MTRRSAKRLVREGELAAEVPVPARSAVDATNASPDNSRRRSGARSERPPDTTPESTVVWAGRSSRWRPYGGRKELVGDFAPFVLKQRDRLSAADERRGDGRRQVVDGARLKPSEVHAVH